jgi:hypothetical protein
MKWAGTLGITGRWYWDWYGVRSMKCRARTYVVATAWEMYIAALFIRLIIRTFQLVFSAGTVFFSHNKSANSVFQPAYQHSLSVVELELEDIKLCSVQRRV